MALEPLAPERWAREQRAPHWTAAVPKGAAFVCLSHTTETVRSPQRERQRDSPANVRSRNKAAYGYRLRATMGATPPRLAARRRPRKPEAVTTRTGAGAACLTSHVTLTAERALRHRRDTHRHRPHDTPRHRRPAAAHDTLDRTASLRPSPTSTVRFFSTHVSTTSQKVCSIHI